MRAVSVIVTMALTCWLARGCTGSWLCWATMRVRRGGGCGCALGEPDTDADAEGDDDAGAEAATEPEPETQADAPEQCPLARGVAASRTRSLAFALASASASGRALLLLLFGMAPTLSSVASDWDIESSSVISCATSLSVSPVSRRLLLATTLEDSSPVMVLLEMLVTLPWPVPLSFLPAPLPAAAAAPLAMPFSLQQRFGEDWLCCTFSELQTIAAEALPAAPLMPRAPLAALLAPAAFC